MVELAVRISLGATLARRWAGAGPAPEPAVRRGQGARVLDGEAQGRRPSVGPFMQSTGEVIGIAEDPRVAMAKALTGASLVPPRRPGDGRAARAALDRRPRQVGARRPRGGAPASRLPAGGDARDARRRSARPGSASTRSRSWARSRTADGEVPILDAIAGGDVRLVVNTPTPRSGAIRDAAEIRHAAIAEGVLCLTAIETAIAAAEALEPAIVDEIADVRPITEWVRRGLAAARSAPGDRDRARRRRLDDDRLAERPQRDRRQRDHHHRERDLAHPHVRSARASRAACDGACRAAAARRRAPPCPAGR